MNECWSVCQTVGRVTWDVVPPCDCRWMSNVVVELVFFPYDFDLSLGQDVFRGGAIKLTKFLVELIVREESLLKCVDCGLLIVEGNRDLSSVEASKTVTKWLTATL